MKEFVTCLSDKDIQNYLSHYLNEGRKQESWKIDEITISGKKLTSRISMHSIYISDTDSGGFHLTIFSALEFLSQLMIIYTHVWAGLKSKSREGWMVESHTRTIRAIRNPKNIHVEMTVSTIRKRGVNLFCDARYRLTDDRDGLFEVRLKGFLA